MKRTRRTAAAFLAAVTVAGAGPSVSPAQSAAVTPGPASPQGEPTTADTRIVGVLPADEAFGHKDLGTAVEAHQKHLRRPQPDDSIEQLRQRLAEAAD
jgi:hypothetical protein